MVTQIPLPLRLDPDLSFERFHPGPNREVVEHLESVAQGVTGAPVYIHGLKASGKTHLLQATCTRSSQQGHLAMALGMKDLPEASPSILDGLNGLDILCLDDIQTIAGNIEWEEALFALFNEFSDQGRQLVFGANGPPSLTPFILEDLRSRLSSGIVFALQPLSEAECLEVLIAQARARGLEIPEPVAVYLIRRVNRDLCHLMEHLETLDVASMAASKKITIPLVKSVLQSDEQGTVRSPN